MPATRENHYDESARRSSFNGKDITFVELVFGPLVVATALGADEVTGTPDEWDSAFHKVSETLREKSTILAQSYRLAADASVGDAALVTDITATNNVDVYTFMVEGADLWGNGETAQIAAIKAAIIARVPGIGDTTAPAVITDNIGVRVSTLRFNGDDSTATLVGFPDGRDG